MIATVINAGAVLIGGIIGLGFKKFITKEVSKPIFQALGLCVLFIGIKGSLEVNNVVIVIVSMVLGVIVGEWVDIDKKLNQFGLFLQTKTSLKSELSIANGFVTASLLFCVGAMSIVGPIQSSLLGNHEILFTKSALDFVASVIFSATLGIGVLLASGFVLIYQGLITIFAGWIEPFLTGAMITDISCVGSLLIIAIGLNLLNITTIKVANLLPAIALPILFHFLIGLF